MLSMSLFGPYFTLLFPEPYITWGTPNLKSVRELVYKRGFVKVRLKLFLVCCLCLVNLSKLPYNVGRNLFWAAGE